MKKIVISALALAALTLLSGCASHEGAYAPQATNKGNLETEAKFVLLDPGAQRSVTSPGIQQRTLPDGRLEITANLRNRENRRIEVQANCVFKDEQFFPVEETPFQTVILTENETQGIKFISSNDKAKNYTIRVRQAR